MPTIHQQAVQQRVQQAQAQPVSRTQRKLRRRIPVQQKAPSTPQQSQLAPSTTPTPTKSYSMQVGKGGRKINMSYKQIQEAYGMLGSYARKGKNPSASGRSSEVTKLYGFLLQEYQEKGHALDLSYARQQHYLAGEGFKTQKEIDKSKIPPPPVKLPGQKPSPFGPTTERAALEQAGFSVKQDVIFKDETVKVPSSYTRVGGAGFVPYDVQTQRGGTVQFRPQTTQEAKGYTYQKQQEQKLEKQIESWGGKDLVKDYRSETSVRRAGPRIKEKIEKGRVSTTEKFFPSLKQERVERETLAKETADISKQATLFEATYKDKSLSQEKYTSATKELEKLNLRIGIQQQKVKDYERESKIETEKDLGVSFGAGLISSPFMLGSMGVGLVTAPGKEIADIGKGIYKLPQEFVVSPVKTTGLLAGSITGQAFLFGGVKGGVKAGKKIKLARAEKIQYIKPQKIKKTPLSKTFFEEGTIKVDFGGKTFQSYTPRVSKQQNLALKKFKEKQSMDKAVQKKLLGDSLMKELLDMKKMLAQEPRMLALKRMKQKTAKAKRKPKQLTAEIDPAVLRDIKWAGELHKKRLGMGDEFFKIDKSGQLSLKQVQKKPQPLKVILEEQIKMPKIIELGKQKKVPSVRKFGLEKYPKVKMPKSLIADMKPIVLFADLTKGPITPFAKTFAKKKAKKIRTFKDLFPEEAKITGNIIGGRQKLILKQKQKQIQKPKQEVVYRIKSKQLEKQISAQAGLDRFRGVGQLYKTKQIPKSKLGVAALTLQKTLQKELQAPRQQLRMKQKPKQLQRYGQPMSLGLKELQKIEQLYSPKIRTPQIPGLKTPKPLKLDTKKLFKKQSKRRKKEIWEEFAYAPGFTEKAIGLKAMSVQEKDLGKLLKQIQTGFEVRRPVKIIKTKKKRKKKK